MSALAQTKSFVPSSRALSEFEALQEISWQAAETADLHSGIRAVLGSALRVKGVAQIEIEPAAALSILNLPLKCGSRAGAPVNGSAVAEIASGGCAWGAIRVRFDLKANGLESPLRFARFIGQQIGGLLHRFHLLRGREALAARKEALRRRIATRKLVGRAKGVIAHVRSVSEEDAFRFLVRLSRESSRSLAQVAEAVVLSQGDVWSRPPKLRRLRAADLTTNYGLGATSSPKSQR
jgi:ANTAR domain